VDLSEFRKVEPTPPIQLSRDPMGTPSGYVLLRGARVYFNAETSRLTIAGEPVANYDPEGAVHNCDPNGCRWEHVIATLDLSKQQTKEFAICEHDSLKLST